MSEKIYKMITEQVIKELEKGVIPWQKPWKNGMAGTPKNLISNKPYRGINPFLLTMVGMSKGYDSCYWLTFKQAKKCKGSVVKGEKGTQVIFWKFLEKEYTDDNGEKQKETFPMLRYYTVFNTEQCKDIDSKRLKELQKEETEKGLDFHPDLEAEKLLASFKSMPDVKHGGTQAFYHPANDYIGMPKHENFKSIDGYYQTLFHEVVHSTGHSSRLDRNLDKSFFGKAEYSKEELIAEFGATFLCGITGINPDIKNSASYVESWLKVLKADSKILIQSAGKAQKAVDYIQDVTFA